jgi:hypothetical protein
MAKLKRVNFSFDVRDDEDRFSDMEVAAMCMEPLMGADFAAIVIPLEMTVDDRPVEDPAGVVSNWDEISKRAHGVQ